MMEGMGLSINHSKASGKIRLQLSENGQVLTHQQFVEDTMLQGIPTGKEVLGYKQILNDFAMAIGMEVNLTKSIFFSLTPTLPFREMFLEFLAFKESPSPQVFWSSANGQTFT